jgi:hypothetical protein
MKFRKIIAVMLLVVLLSSHFSPCFAALTITSSVVTDWTAVAAQGTGESAVIDISANYATAVHIQAFLDTATAHEGTEFVIQVSSNSSGDEDWSDLTKFSGLVGTANTEPITDNPLAATSTTITVADTGGGYETEPMGKWIAIEDGTLVNSELIWLTGFTADTNITCQDGTTNAHVQTTAMFDIALSKTIVIPFGSGSRARVIVNNGVDMDGTASTLNFKVSKTATTALN